MDERTWTSRCACKKVFHQPNSFSNHIRTCSRYKQGLGETLQNAKTKYANKRKQKRGKEAIESWYGDGELDIDLEPEVARSEANVSHSNTLTSCSI